MYVHDVLVGKEAAGFPYSMEQWGDQGNGAVKCIPLDLGLAHLLVSMFARLQA